MRNVQVYGACARGHICGEVVEDRMIIEQDQLFLPLAGIGYSREAGVRDS